MIFAVIQADDEMLGAGVNVLYIIVRRYYTRDISSVRLSIILFFYFATNELKGIDFAFVISIKLLPYWD